MIGINEKSHATLDLIRQFFLVLSFIMFLFINVDDATGLHILAPHIEGLVIYFHVILLIIVIVIITIIQKGIWSIDAVGTLLLMKCGFDLIAYCLNINTVSSGYFGYFASSITAFASYLIFRQGICNAKQYYKYFLLFGMVLAIQTIHTFFLAGVDYTSIYYKSNINVPYGATNIIASGLVPVVLLPFFMDIHKWKKIVISIFLIIGVIFTKSRGGMLLTVFAILAAVLFTDLIKKNKLLKRIALTGLILLFVLLLLNNENVDLILSGYMNQRYDLNSFTTGRVKLFYNDFLHFLERPIFGHGLGIGGTNVSGTHNLLIDLLYKCGITGFLTYCAALWQLWKGRKDPYFSFFVFIMFLNSLFEVCYFSYKCDTIFWCAAGLAMAQTQEVHTKNLNSLTGTLTRQRRS